VASDHTRIGLTGGTIVLTSSQSALAHPHTEMLRTICADLTRMQDYVSDTVLVHGGNRTVEDPHPLVGKEAVLAQERALLGAAAIVANDRFGAVGRPSDPSSAGGRHARFEEGQRRTLAERLRRTSPGCSTGAPK
jgi:hypothetical protein